jgi:hypothetical protein
MADKRIIVDFCRFFILFQMRLQRCQSVFKIETSRNELVYKYEISSIFK